MAASDRYHYPCLYERRSEQALETALSTAPVYRNWRAFDPGAGSALNARYSAMPELKKDDMRESFPQGLVPNGLSVEEGLKRDEIEYTFTSGTTGEKVINLWNQKWWYASEEASWKLNAHTARLSYPQREAKLASALNVGIHCEEDLPMEHRTMGRILYLNEKINVICWQTRHFERMAAELERFKPAVLEANPSLLARLCWWAIDTGAKLYSPEVIIFSYEYPSVIHLAAIRRVFTSPLISSYGTTETGFVMMQCEDGLFHQNTEFCRIDYQPLSERHGGPELGRILVTTFGNPWASVLRFDAGDLIRLHPSSECPCGRHEGLIAEAIEGRIANATFTVDGRLVTTMALDTALAQVPEIRDYHLEQQSTAAYALQLVLTDNKPEVLAHIRGVLTDLYGAGGEYSLTAVDNLWPGPAGKYRRTQANFEFDQKELFI